ncbi:TPA: helix-turn-helix transcriptional regulator, partial [Streptococcus agalactiae]|nr:helix-turn-helix transcriptional regulator [Streptococcus agalactiae]
MSNVKNRLAELIRKSKFTKKELAHEIKVNPRTITRWERSESPIPSDKIKILADLLDTNITYLLGQSDFNLNEITHVGKDYFGDDINILQRDRLEFLKTLKNEIDTLKNTSIS